MARGWTRREAGWLALVCLHSGVFFRSWYLAFIGRTNPALANRFIRRCRTVAVEQPWNGSRLRLCRIAARRLYRWTVPGSRWGSRWGPREMLHRQRGGATQNEWGV